MEEGSEDPLVLMKLAERLLDKGTYYYLYLLILSLSIVCISSTLKIHKKSNLDWNLVKISTQHKNMYAYQKKL